MRRQVMLLFTCEHGGNTVPVGYRKLFRGAGDVLKSHRGWDPGALKIAKNLAAHFQAPLFYSITSRLLIELNRSLHHRALFSEFARGLPPEEKQKLIDTYYFPYRNRVEEHIVR